MTLSFPVRRFAEEMEKELTKHDESKGICGWLGHLEEAPIYFMEKISEHADKLSECSMEWNKNGMMEECVHIANYAMMIHSRLVKQRYMAGEGNVKGGKDEIAY